MKLLVLIPLLFTCCLQSTLSRAEEASIDAKSTNTTPAATTLQPELPPQTNWNSFEAAFKDGIASYQGKKFAEARLAFSRALEFNPESLNTLVNLGLTEFELGEKGLAVALLRKASDLDPNFSTPKAALNFILPRMDVKEIPHEIQLTETLRDSLLVTVSLNTYLALTALFLFASGWLAFNYIGRSKRAIRDEQALPGFPMVASLAFVGLLVFSFLTFFKVWDHQIPRATVVAQKIPVLSAPDEKSPSLFDLYAGLEVIVRQAQGNWVQVTYPGALSGWIPKTSLFVTSGKKIW